MKANAAVHAGNITYSWLHGYTYQIKYTIYTDNVSSTNYCTLDSLCFGDGTSGSIIRSNGPCTGMCSPACEGQVLPGAVYKMNEYVTTHTYPGPGNYLICLEVPNRNAGIINIPNSVNQVFYIESFLVIPTFGTGKNTSTVFGNHPIADGCSNNGCYTYNPSAIDADGDSLSYEIAPCKGHSVPTVPGFTYPNSGPGGSFCIGPLTGTLSWCNPQMNGLYNVVIRIKEWRKDDGGDYYMIGYVERDTQFSISTCTDIKEEKASVISIHPNPADKEINILLNQSDETITIGLIDVTGRKIKTITAAENITQEHSIHLNLEGINPGIYFLKITGDQHSSITKKIIKQ